ncbi:MAG: 2-dehydro-3-deoxygalactonokinase [Paracoccaceae bacterium]
MNGPADTSVNWIAVDWGTTHLRAWLVGDGENILDRAASDRGMSTLARPKFEPALLEIIGCWLPPARATQVICCGMAGSRQGWVEAPYLTVPCEPLTGAALSRAPVGDSRIEVFVIPGIKQMHPPDVMRGEETQIAGLLARQPEFDGVACLPGTHSKWIRVSAGEIVSFATYLTGEMFSLLAQHSVLRHSVSAGGWDDGRFLEALGDAIAKPEAVAAKLFGLRAQSLIGDLPPQTARAALSGYLVGLELAASRPYWLGQRVAVIGSDALRNIYSAALGAQGLSPEPMDSEALTIAGLSAAHSRLNERVFDA